MAYTAFSFNYLVIIISSIILIITLAYVGFSIYYYTNYVEHSPPTVNACPDYWDIDSSGNCIIPKNGNNMGSISTVLIPNASYKVPVGYTIVDVNSPNANSKLSNSVLYTCTGVPVLNRENKIMSSNNVTYTGLDSKQKPITNDKNQCYYTGNLANYDPSKMICKYTFKYNIPDNINLPYSLNIQDRMNPNDRIWSRLGSPHCSQHSWSRSNNVEWEGISNYNKC